MKNCFDQSNCWSRKASKQTFFFLAWIKVLREADSLASSSKCRHIRQDWNWIFHSGRLPNCLGEVFESACDHFDSFSTTSKGRSKKIWAQILKGKYFLQTLRNLWFHTRLEFLSTKLSKKWLRWFLFWYCANCSKAKHMDL